MTEIYGIEDYWFDPKDVYDVMFQKYPPELVCQSYITRHFITKINRMITDFRMKHNNISPKCIYINYILIDYITDNQIFTLNHISNSIGTMFDIDIFHNDYDRTKLIISDIEIQPEQIIKHHYRIKKIQSL
ncbi:hypothetical protein M0Q50_03360 [bacterium]|jgi:hypothetical protein|nr:hypothetical protein [bacterium]